jgi:hypothetical protein
MRLVPSLLHPPQALDVVQTSSTRSPKGEPALAGGAGGAEPRRAAGCASPAPRLDFRFPLQRNRGIEETGNLTQTLELTNCSAFSQCIGNEGQALSLNSVKGPERSKFGANSLKVLLLRNWEKMNE